MSNISKKIMFGDDRGKDFTPMGLPQNRRQQFSYLIKTRFIKLFYVNLLVCLFALPLMVWHILCLAYGFSFSEINAENFGEYFQYVVYYKSTLRLILAIPAAYGIAGGLHIIRLVSWGEPISLIKTFFRGIRLNIKQFTLFGIIYGVGAGLYDAANLLLSFVYSGSSVEKILLYCGMLISVLLILSIAIFLITLCSTYSIQMMTAIKNSAVLATKTLIKTLGILCVSVLPFLIVFSLGNLYIDIIGGVVLGLFGYSLILCIVSLYTNGIYDELINVKDYPEYYRCGLAPLNNSEVDDA